MHLKYESFVREPLVDGDKDYHQITEDICRTIENPPTRLWKIGFFLSAALLLFGIFGSPEVAIGDLIRPTLWGLKFWGYPWRSGCFLLLYPTHAYLLIMHWWNCGPTSS